METVISSTEETRADLEQHEGDEMMTDFLGRTLQLSSEHGCSEACFLMTNKRVRNKTVCCLQ